MVMAQGDGYAPRGRRAGARGSLDHSRSSRCGRPKRARRRSLWRGVGLDSGIRCRLPRPSLASEAVVEKGRGQGESTPGRGAGRSARVRRRREAPGALSLFPLRPAGGARRKAERSARGCSGLVPAQVPAQISAPAPTAAEMHEVCSHQGHEQQSVKAQC